MHSNKYLIKDEDLAEQEGCGDNCKCHNAGKCANCGDNCDCKNES